MPIITLIYAIGALASLAGVIWLLSHSPGSRARSRVAALLISVTVLLLVLGARNALLVSQHNQASRHVERGRELLQQGRPEKAEREFRKAVRLDPKNTDAQRELEQLEKARRKAEERAAQGTGQVAPSGTEGRGFPRPASRRSHPQRRESQVTITTYALDVELFPDEHRLNATATFDVRAKKGKLKSFDIALSPECTIKKITVSGKPAKMRRSDEWIEIMPEIRLSSQQPLEVVIAYEGFGKDRLSPAGDVISPEGSYLRPESRWCPAIGFLEFRAPVRVRISVPEGQIALGPGVLTQTRETPRGTVSEWHCRQNAMGVCIAAGPWKRIEGKQGHLPIAVLLWKKHADQGEKLLREAQRIVQYYSSLFGDFPYDKLTIAEIPFFPGGYSPSTMVLLGELILEKEALIQKVLAHEIAHQWWGNLVLPQGPGAGWLAEGFAEYCSILYLGHTNGEKAFRRALWDAKQQYHLLMQNPPEEPIIETDPFDQQGSYVGVVYSKGAYVLHMLRYVVGDRAFFATLRRFCDSHRYGVATIADFRREAEKHSGHKLDWFFEQWLERTGTIELTYDWTTTSLGDGRYQTTIVLEQQSERPYRTPIDLQLVTGQGKLLSTEKLSNKRDEYRFLTESRPRDIDVDPHDNLLLAVPKRMHSTQ